VSVRLQLMAAAGRSLPVQLLGRRRS
jgi:hypothetical protein